MARIGQGWASQILARIEYGPNGPIHIALVGWAKMGRVSLFPTSNDDAASWVWSVPRFKDIPLGSAKVPGLGFLGFVTSGLVLSHSLRKMIPLFLFVCL